MQTRFYISGKITGVPGLNREKFEAAANYIRFHHGTGVEVINPHTILHIHDGSWVSYMKVDLRHLLASNAIVVLDDWKRSRGAIIEVLLASLLSIPVYTLAGIKEPKQRLRVTLWLKIQVIFKLFINRF
jgi:hypothetical protein